jgi:hypothetical protein
VIRFLRIRAGYTGISEICLMLDSRFGLVKIAAFVGLTFACVVLLQFRVKSGETIRDLTRDNAELKSRLEEKDRAITDLKGSLNPAIADPPKGPIETGAVVDASATLELARRLEATASIQQQTLELVQKLGKRMGALDTERSPEQIKSQLAGVEQARDEINNKLVQAKKKVGELVITLAVPDEVAMMEPSKAMRIPSLQRYWPFFEAARERENMEMVADRLNLRIIQEQVDGHRP